MKVSFTLVLLLVVFSYGGKKKKKSKSSGSFDFKKIFLRYAKTTVKPTTSAPATVQQVEDIDSFNWMTVNTSAKFFEVFPQLKAIDKNPGSSIGSSGEVVSIGCGLQGTIVPLPRPPGYNQIVYPPCVVLNRCAGCCFMSNIQGCKPTAVVKKKVVVHHVTISSGMSAAASHISGPQVVEVEEHLGCGCQCIRSPSSCNNRTQDFDPGRCQCLCKPQYQQQNMNCDGKVFTYNPKTCSCTCAKAPEECREHSNMIWSEADCSCVCTDKIMNEPCKDRFMYRDPDTCKCVYA